MKHAAIIASIIAGVLGAYGLVDAIERDTEARLAYSADLRAGCIPTRAGENAIIINDGMQLRCRIYSDAGGAMVPKLVSAAVLEAPL